MTCESTPAPTTSPSSRSTGSPGNPPIEAPAASPPGFVRPPGQGCPGGGGGMTSRKKVVIGRCRSSRAVRMFEKTRRLASNLCREPSLAWDIGRTLSRRKFVQAGRMALTASRSSKVRNEAMSSRKFGFLWLPNAKVASRAIRVALVRTDPETVVFAERTVAEIYAEYPEVREHYSFAFIRHPFERALSFYAHLFDPLMNYPDQLYSDEMKTFRGIFRHFHGLNEVRSFDDYCRWLNTKWGSDRFADRHFRSQHVQIRLPDGRMPDFVGRLENIGEDFERIAHRVGMPTPALPILGTRAGWSAPPEAVESARTTMRVHLTDRNRALLTARYEDDLKLYRNVCENGLEPPSGVRWG